MGTLCASLKNFCDATYDHVTYLIYKLFLQRDPLVRYDVFLIIFLVNASRRSPSGNLSIRRRSSRLDLVRDIASLLRKLI